MTFFTDSPFERMMVQQPQYRQEERPPAPLKSQLDRSRDCYHNLITQKDGKPER